LGFSYGCTVVPGGAILADLGPLNGGPFLWANTVKLPELVRRWAFGRCGQPSVPKKQDVTDQTGYCWHPRLSGEGRGLRTSATRSLVAFFPV